MNLLTPSQVERFHALFEQIQHASPSEREAQLAKETDAAVREYVSLSLAIEPLFDLDALAGRKVEGYHLKKRLGAGTFGVVYQAESAPGTFVAVKFLRPEHAEGFALEAFRQEIERLKQLSNVRHAGVVRILDYGEFSVGPNGGAPTIPFLVTDYIEGQPLDVFVRATDPWKTKVELFAQVAEAVHAFQDGAPAGVVHSDLKPANILVTHRGVPVILDYGMAQVLRRFAPTPSLGGTPQYMAPEQLAPHPTVDLRTDVYSLGVIFFQLLAGRLPYEVEDAESIRPQEYWRRVEACIRQGKILRLRTAVQADLPESIDAILAKALGTQPKDRFATAREFALALRSTLETAQPPAKGTEVTQIINAQGPVTAIAQVKELTITM